MKYPALLFLLPILFSSCFKKEIKQEKTTENPFYDKAFAYRETKKPDSAFLYFNKAKDFFIQQNDSLGAGKCLVNMAIISADRGDYFGGQELSLNAIAYFNEKDQKQHVYIQSNYNNLGITSDNLKEYKQAITFYEKSKKYTVGNLGLLVVQNNIANAYKRLKNYPKALAIYKDILAKNISQTEYARTLTNLVYTEWLQNEQFNAAPPLLKALKIRELENDIMGLNYSYFALADYYTKKKPDSALYFAERMYQTAKEINNPGDQLQALQKLIKLSGPANSKRYFDRYQNLEDSLQTIRNAAKNQFALIRYESEKTKADNLKLQKENTEKKYEVATREFLLLAGFITFLSAAIIGAFWYRKRKENMKAEAQKAITESRLKTSKKVHDVVANGLYRVMTEIENELNLNKELILDKIENLYEKSRDISYEKPVSPDKPFNEIISALLSSFATENTKILIAGNDAELWLKVNEQSRYELEHIIQELMVNMQKHSKASNVALRFENINEQINIYYTDNGLGMPEDATLGNGLRNTGNRIEQIKGAITFDTKVQKGLKIQISFPVS
ncbi:tetratricopeptide repeat-containing sensor histidine kinase [Pedobacter sp.]|uniref:tetratricopeptide repeat-containing sensor histidine kinase n=1 Tax=Pedobacter sp. TaxID=1411316 RepID=UPI003C66895D